MAIKTRDLYISPECGVLDMYFDGVKLMQDRDEYYYPGAPDD